jgi:CubicO group peptidase (beta-lactamase class C family)
VSDRWDPPAHLLRDAIDARTFPAAVAEVGSSDRVLWRASFGTLTFDSGAPSITTNGIFDLASLTKPLATTLVALELERAGQLSLDEPIAVSFVDWRGSDRDIVTVRDLLAHSAGLSARLLERAPSSRREFEYEISTQPLEYTPRTKSIYSDLGFILLGFLVADRGGATLDAQFDRLRDRIWSDIAAEPSAFLQFGVPRSKLDQTAPTMALDEDRRQGRLVGEVHDNYAALLGGVAGHAGLFGNAAGAGAMARAWLRGARGLASSSALLSSDMVARAIARGSVPGSSRALGWDTMLPTSSCGPDMSPASFGHAGFTGVTVWVDPAADRYFVLLTNRACEGGTQDEMQAVRRAFHTAARAAALT